MGEDMLFNIKAFSFFDNFCYVNKDLYFSFAHEQGSHSNIKTQIQIIKDGQSSSNVIVARVK